PRGDRQRQEREGDNRQLPADRVRLGSVGEGDRKNQSQRVLMLDQTRKRMIATMLFSSRNVIIGLGSAIVALSLFIPASGQKNGASKLAPAQAAQKAPAVKQIDLDGLRKALTPSAKPLLVNFWATWCDPCRDEFPDLVKLNADYKGKIDFITISLDELSEIDRDVPKFLADMKAGMPAYLLKAQDAEAAIAFVPKEWSEGIRLSLLYDPSGKQSYYRQGKVKIDTVRAEIEKLLTPGN